MPFSPDYITNAPGDSCTTLTDSSTLDYARSCFCVFVNEGHQMWPVILVCYLLGHCFVPGDHVPLPLCCSFACAPFLQDNTFLLLLLACLHTLQGDRASSVQSPSAG